MENPKLYRQFFSNKILKYKSALLKCKHQKCRFKNLFTFLLFWNARSTKMFIALSKGMLVKSDWMSNEAINSEKFLSLISLQKENYSVSSLTINSLRIGRKTFAILYVAIPIVIKLVKKVRYQLRMNYIYKLYTNHTWY